MDKGDDKKLFGSILISDQRINTYFFAVTHLMEVNKNRFFGFTRALVVPLSTLYCNFFQISYKIDDGDKALRGLD